MRAKLNTLSFFIIFTGLLLLIPVIDAQNRNNGREVVESAIISVVDIRFDGFMDNKHVSWIDLTIEVWNPSFDTVYITYPTSCTGKINAIANVSALNLQTYPLANEFEVCSQALTEVEFQKGLTKTSISHPIILPGYNQMILPDMTIELFFDVGQTIENTFFTSVIIKNGEWSVVFDPLPDNWGEIADELAQYLIGGMIISGIIFVIYIFKTKPWNARSNQKKINLEKSKK